LAQLEFRACGFIGNATIVTKRLARVERKRSRPETVDRRNVAARGGHAEVRS
jgi:hypothetical protein